MNVVYNEIEPFAASWLQELMFAGELPWGRVDGRPIQRLIGADLVGARQFHTFAGIGGWPLALSLAGWPEEREVWTGSCPCQPFSSAGKGKGVEDERHLWPDFLRLIALRRPATIFGEQVASAAGKLWLAGVRSNLEALGYRVGAADLCAASVGAPHIRQRLYWVADDDGTRWDTRAAGREIGAQEELGVPATIKPAARLADGNGAGLDRLAQQDEQAPRGDAAPRRDDVDGRRGAPWAAAIPMEGADGTWRALEPGVFPLAHGLPRHRGLLRAYGNAIVPTLAAEFVGAFLDGEKIDLDVFGDLC